MGVGDRLSSGNVQVVVESKFRYNINADIIHVILYIIVTVVSEYTNSGYNNHYTTRQSDSSDA